MRFKTSSFALAALLVGTGPLSAQDFTGTYTLRAPAGNIVTLVLTQDRQGRIRGQLSGNETVVQIEGQLDAGGTMVGSSTSSGRRGFAGATLHGDSLQLMFADFGSDGVPDFSTAGAVILLREGAPGAPRPPVAPRPQQAPAPTPGQAPAVDQQLTQLLLSSAWCSFSYSQTSGRTSTARYRFRPDGTLTYGTNTEGGTVNQQGGGTVGLGGGATGSVYGQSQGSGQLRWRVQQGTLQLDQGEGFQLVALRVTRNSSGYPIIIADGTEYSQCN